MASSKGNGKADRQQGEDTAERQREIQQQQDRRDAAKTPSAGKQAAETGTREHPRPPLPAQHLEKPGMEKDLDLAPQYAAPGYKGSEKLLDMVALITGADS